MSLQNKYLLSLDQRPVGPVHLLLCSQGVPPRQPPPIPRSITRFHIRRHLLLANSFIQLLPHQTRDSLRQVHRPFQADGDLTVSLPESSAIAKARWTVLTGMSTDIPSTVAGKANILSPFSLLNCLLMESSTILIFHTSRQTLKQMPYKIKQTIQLRLSEIHLYPIILQVRRPFDNTASSCPVGYHIFICSLRTTPDRRRAEHQDSLHHHRAFLEFETSARVLPQSSWQTGLLDLDRHHSHVHQSLPEHQSLF